MKGLPRVFLIHELLNEQISLSLSLSLGVILKRKFTISRISAITSRSVVYYFDRFDPEFHQTTSSRRNIARKNMRTKKKSKKINGRSTATKGRQRQRRRRSSTRGRARKQSVSVPRPKLPRPPSWSPKRRYLGDEPIPKVIKHS